MAISNSAPDVGWAWAQLQSRPSLYPLAMNHNRLNQPLVVGAGFQPALQSHPGRQDQPAKEAPKC